jgi:hypothetical protein
MYDRSELKTSGRQERETKVLGIISFRIKLIVAVRICPPP